MTTAALRMGCPLSPHGPGQSALLLFHIIFKETPGTMRPCYGNWEGVENRRDPKETTLGRRFLEEELEGLQHGQKMTTSAQGPTVVASGTSQRDVLGRARAPTCDPHFGPRGSSTCIPHSGWRTGGSGYRQEGTTGVPSHSYASPLCDTPTRSQMILLLVPSDSMVTQAFPNRHMIPIHSPWMSW